MIWKQKHQFSENWPKSDDRWGFNFALIFDRVRLNEGGALEKLETSTLAHSNIHPTRSIEIGWEISFLCLLHLIHIFPCICDESKIFVLLGLSSFDRQFLFQAKIFQHTRETKMSRKKKLLPCFDVRRPRLDLFDIETLPRSSGTRW